MTRTRFILILFGALIAIRMVGYAIFPSIPQAQPTAEAPPKAKPTPESSEPTNTDGQADSELGPNKQAFDPTAKVAEYEHNFPNHPMSKPEFEWLGRETNRQMLCYQAGRECTVEPPPPDVLAAMECGMRCRKDAQQANDSAANDEGIAAKDATLPRESNATKGAQ